MMKEHKVRKDIKKIVRWTKIVEMTGHRQRQGGDSCRRPGVGGRGDTARGEG